MRKVIGFFLSVVIGNFIVAQPINVALQNQTWSAHWIQAPNTAPNDYGVYFFRKQINIVQLPQQYWVHVSADNRYKLYVNGQLVSLGPARSDLNYWNYTTIDLKPFLKTGFNIIAAEVWNESSYRPEAQISHRTGWLMQGNSAAESAVNTNSSWKSFICKAYQPLSGIGYAGYYVAGPGEIVNMHHMPLHWKEIDFNDDSWPSAVNIGWSGAKPKGVGDINEWMLVPGSLPPMELTDTRIKNIRSAIGVVANNNFLLGNSPIQIPAHSSATLLLDNAQLTNAFVHVLFSGGNNATLTLTYAEALFEKDANGKPTLQKGNRNEIANKVILGRKDSIIASGEQHQLFTSLSWRTFRYIQLQIVTTNDPITVQDIYTTFIGYPYQLNAAVETSDTMLHKILHTGWHTARLCAIETFMDCPYYEQLQYIGDSRIQALVALYNSGDDRLVRNALNQMDHSRMAEGITLSRHPSYTPQQIPTFSLWYIGMLADYWKYRGDSIFIAQKLQGVRNILWFFQQYQQKDGSLQHVPYWMFTDWVDGHTGWNGGTAPYSENGSSAILDLQLLWAYQIASQLEKQLGMPAYEKLYNTKATQLQHTIMQKYWRNEVGLLSDIDDGNLFSQHANALAILTNTVNGTTAKNIARQLLNNKQLAPASIYFKYYVHQALIKAGLGNDYLDWLSIWQQNLAMGLTTWAETSDINGSRSDCHAWGASPNIEIYRTVLGIDSDAPGFKSVKISPHLGKLTNISGQIPHPYGTIAVAYKKLNGQWQVNIHLPEKLNGKLEWKQHSYPLHGGSNAFTLP